MTGAMRIGMLVAMRAPWVVGCGRIAVVVGLLAVTACGRIAFDPSADAGGDAATGDGSQVATPRVLAFDRFAQNGPLGAVQTSFDVPAGSNFLLVSINIASNCAVDTNVTMIA